MPEFELRAVRPRSRSASSSSDIAATRSVVGKVRLSALITSWAATSGSATPAHRVGTAAESCPPERASVSREMVLGAVWFIVSRPMVIRRSQLAKSVPPGRGLVQDRAVQAGPHNLCVAQVCAGQIGHQKRRCRQGSAAQVCAGQIGPGQVRRGQVGPAEVGLLQIGVGQGGVGQVGAPAGRRG